MNPARRPQDALRQRRDGMNDFRKLVSSAVKCPFGEKNNVAGAEIEKGTIIRVRTGKEIRFRFWLSEDKAGKEAKCRPTGW